MIKEHLLSVDFKDIATIFNNAVRLLKIKDTIYPEEIREKIFVGLVKEFPDLGLIATDYNHNHFQITFPYKTDFCDIKNFDSGSIIIHFKIVTQKTDRLKTISRTRKKFFFSRSDNPVRFEYADVSHEITTFSFVNTSPIDLSIKHETKENWFNGSNRSYAGNSIKAILDSIVEYYPEYYREKIVVPFTKVLWETGSNKREMLFREMPKTILDDLKSKERFKKAIKDLTDWIIVSKLVKIEK